MIDIFCWLSLEAKLIVVPWVVLILQEGDLSNQLGNRLPDSYEKTMINSFIGQRYNLILTLIDYCKEKSK